MSLVKNNSILNKTLSPNEIWKGHPASILDDTRVIHVNCETNEPGTLTVWHSMTNQNWHHFNDVFKCDSNHCFEVVPRGRFMYLQYENSGSAALVNVGACFFKQPTVATQNMIGYKGDIHDGSLDYDTETAHYNCLEFKDSVISLTIPSMPAGTYSGSFDVYASNSVSDNPAAGVFIGSLFPVKETASSQYVAVSNANLGPFHYIWAKNQFNDVANVIISVFSS